MIASARPIFRNDFSLHLTSEESTLFQTKRSTGLPREKFGFEYYRQWKLPKAYARYLDKADGRKTHAEIAASLVDGFEELSEIIANEVVAKLAELNVLDYVSDEAQAPDPGRISGSFDSFTPLHISFEITDTCNFRCDHCYVSASPEKLGRKSYSDTVVMLDKLLDAGVRVIELTGGECTTHPDFSKILKYCAERFDIVAVISNGYLLGKRPELLNLVASFENVMVQISLDGLESHHDEFRKMPGSFKYANKAIKGLRDKGVFVRVSSSVTESNIDEVVDIYKLVKELNASTLIFSTVTSFGRGANLQSCNAMDYHISHSISQKLKPYAEDPLFDAIRMGRESAKENGQINCGAGWRSFALNSDGNVRSCLYLAESKKFGNLDVHTADSVFSQPSMKMFRDAPSPGGEVCRGVQPNGDKQCRYLGTCIGCFAKAFKVSEDQYPECPWRARYFPGMQLGLQNEELAISVGRAARKAANSIPLRELSNQSHELQSGCSGHSCGCS